MNNNQARAYAILALRNLLNRGVIFTQIDERDVLRMFDADMTTFIDEVSDEDAELKADRLLEF